jgi:hypothetical protein
MFFKLNTNLLLLKFFLMRKFQFLLLDSNCLENWIKKPFFINFLNHKLQQGNKKLNILR